jgi:hypothetical protein
MVFAILACAATHAAADCRIDYPFPSFNLRTDVVFREPKLLAAIEPQGDVVATAGLTIKAWYTDDSPLLLGVRQVVVKTGSGKTKTNYDVSPYREDGVLYPQVGTTAVDGDQAGTDTSSCPPFLDLCDRPLFPALFLTDVTTNPGSTAGDWQSFGTAIPPHAVFGPWTQAVRTVDKTRTPPRITVEPDDDGPSRNHWNIPGGDPVPPGLNDEGYGAEVRWNVDDLVAAGLMRPGHTYRLQVMVHDGEQTKPGGNAAQGCTTVTIPQCADDLGCDDGTACTIDTCESSVCRHELVSGCVPCAVDADCTDEYACSTDTCTAGACAHAWVEGCATCERASDCDDGDICTTQDCVDGFCRSTFLPVCSTCSEPADCGAGRNACSIDTCEIMVEQPDYRLGLCRSYAIPGCTPCWSAADCDDGNASTDDRCNGSRRRLGLPFLRGSCEHVKRDLPSGPGETCGDCVDNDGNGLTDFEDAACCSASAPLEMARARIMPHLTGMRFLLNTQLPAAGAPAVDPTKQDVVVQVRLEEGRDVLCARVPARKFMKRRHRFLFRDHAHEEKSARGLDDMTVRVRRDGEIHLRTHGRRVEMTKPAPGRLQVTVGFLSGDETEENRCASTMAPFRTGKRGALLSRPAR